jgi:hypothetical protein
MVSRQCGYMIKITCLILFLSTFKSVFADMQLNLGLGTSAFYDSNPALHPAGFEFLQDSYGLILKPGVNFHLSTPKSTFDIISTYLEEAYSDTTQMNNLSGLSISSVWSRKMSETLRFSLSDTFNQSMMDRDDRDIPEIRGTARWNELKTGIVYGKEQDLIIKAYGTWRIKRYKDLDLMGYLDSYDLENWNEYSASAFFHYYLIPEISFLSKIVYMKRKFPDYQPVPGHTQSIGSFGFRTHLPYGTEIQADILIYVYEFDGEVPRRMKPGYTNFGVELEITHPFSHGWQFNIKGGSIYEMSERSPRYFYHLETISARVEYNSQTPYIFRSRIRHSKLEYLGLEPRLVVYETLADLTLGYKISKWCEINGFYWFLKRTREMPEYDTDAGRLGIELNFMVPVFH